MMRVALILFTIISGVLMGSFMVFSLALGDDTAKPIIIAVVLGALCAMPLSWILAGKLSEKG
jgi:hypothetical protein